MLRCVERKGAIHFSVLVVARASRSEIVGEHDGHLRVRVAAPPVEGAANSELVRTLSKAFHVPGRDVEITGGHASKLKQVRVSGADCETLQTLAGARRV